MPDRVFYPLAALAALAMIALALIWPRGMGAALPSFSHPLTAPAPIAEIAPRPALAKTPAAAAAAASAAPDSRK